MIEYAEHLFIGATADPPPLADPVTLFIRRWRSDEKSERDPRYFDDKANAFEHVARTSNDYGARRNARVLAAKARARAFALRRGLR